MCSPPKPIYFLTSKKKFVRKRLHHSKISQSSQIVQKRGKKKNINHVQETRVYKHWK